MRPHKIRYWLHSTQKEEEPEVFAEKVNEICEVYRNAQEISRKGDYTISTDEMTGIQALEHKYPDKPPRVSAQRWSLNISVTERPV